MKTEIKPSIIKDNFICSIEVEAAKTVSITGNCEVVALPSGNLYISFIGTEFEIKEFVKKLTP